MRAPPLDSVSPPTLLVPCPAPPIFCCCTASLARPDDTVAGCSRPQELPDPQAVTVGHLYITPKSYGLRVLASTSRYKRKFVTTVYYRPVHVATPAAEGAKTRTSAAGEGGAPEGEDFGRGSKLSTSDARAIDSR